MIPLDVTTPHELRFQDYKDKVDPEFESTSSPSQQSAKSPLVHFTSSFLERTREIMLGFGNDAMELHDVVVVWCAISLPALSNCEQHGWTTRKRKFDIEW